MSVLDASFHVVDEASYDSQKTRLVAFPKAAAQEFQLLARRPPFWLRTLQCPFAQRSIPLMLL